MANAQSDGWVLCPSKSFPGKFYYFNVRNGKTAWSLADAETKVTKPPGSIQQESNSHKHPEPTSPPVPEPIRHDLPSSSMHQPAPVFGQSVFPKALPKPDEANFVWTPIHIQMPILLQNQGNCSTNAVEYPELRDYSSWDGVKSQVNPTYNEVTNSQLTQTQEASFTRTPVDPECKEVLVQACQVPFSQRFINFEVPCVSFSKDNKLNIKRLSQKFLTSTPIKQNSSLPRDPRTLNRPKSFQSNSNSNLSFADLKPKINKPIIMEPVLNIGSPSKAMLLGSNGEQPTSTQTTLFGYGPFSKEREHVLNTGPIKTNERVFNYGTCLKTHELDRNSGLELEPVFNYGPCTKTNEPILKPGLPTRTNDPIFYYEPSTQTNELILKPGLPTRIKEPVFNYGQCAKTNEPVSNPGQASRIKEPVFNYGPCTKTDELILNPGLPSRIKEPVFNYGQCAKTNDPVSNPGLPTRIKEPVFNYEPCTKTNGPVSNPGLPTRIKEPVNYEPGFKTNKPVINPGFPTTKEPTYNHSPSNNEANVEIPSKSPKKDIDVEPNTVLKPCLKVDKFENSGRTLHDDLRELIVARKRRPQESGDTGVESKRTKLPNETPVKKKVTFSLDLESISSMPLDDDDGNCAFIEKNSGTMMYLKSLAGARSAERWYILPDLELLIQEFRFLDQLVRIDPSCSMLVPAAVRARLAAAARGASPAPPGGRGRGGGRGHAGAPAPAPAPAARCTAARHALRRLHDAHVTVQPECDRDSTASLNDAILKCCVETMDKNIHLVLISNNLELLTTAKCYPIPCYSMNSIKNGLAKKTLQFKKDMKITFRNDTGDLKTDLANDRMFDNNVPNEKKVLSQNFKPFVHNTDGSMKSNSNLNVANNISNINSNISNNNPGISKQAPTKTEIYHEEHLRIANAIAMSMSNAMSQIDSERATQTTNTSAISNESRGISNLSAIPNDSMEIDISKNPGKSIISNNTISNKTISNNTISNNTISNYRIPKTAQVGRRYTESEFTTTTIEDEVQKLNINKHNETTLTAENTVSSVFFQKPNQTFDFQKFKYSPKIKISFRNNSLPENENKILHSNNQEPQISVMERNDSIFEFCKEKPIALEHSTLEYENLKINMASELDKKSNMASEIDKKCNMSSEFVKNSNMASVFNKNSNVASEFVKKTNMTPEFNKKSNMASVTSNSLDVAKPQTILNTYISDFRYHVQSKVMENRLKARMDEWLCCYTQIMEENLTSALENISHTLFKTPPPWSMLEALQCIRSLYKDHDIIQRNTNDICSYLYDNNGMYEKMKKFVTPDGFIQSLGCGVKLIEYLKKVLLLPTQDGERALADLLQLIETDEDPTIDLDEPSVRTPALARPDELPPRQNFVKNRSEITDYLKKHFPDWKDYDPRNDYTVLRTLGKNPLKLEKRDIYKQVMQKGIDSVDTDIIIDDVAKDNCDRSNHGVDIDDRNNGVTKCDNNYDGFGKDDADCDKFKLGDVNNVGDGNECVGNVNEVNIDKIVKDVAMMEQKQPKVIRNIRRLAEFENRLRKRKVNEKINKNNQQTEQIKHKNNKKSKNDDRNDNNNKKHVRNNDNQKSTVIAMENDPKLTSLGPRVIVRANLIKEYEEKMKNKSKVDKFDNSAETGDNNDNDSQKHIKVNKKYNTDYQNNHYTEDKLSKHKLDNHNNKNNDNKDVTDNDNNLKSTDNIKDVTTDSGLGNEIPRWSTIVESYTAEIGRSLNSLHKYTVCGLPALRATCRARRELYRMRAFQAAYLGGKLLVGLQALLRGAGDGSHRSLNAVLKYMEQAKSINKVVNSILVVTNDISDDITCP